MRKAAGGGSESGLLAEDLEVIRESLRTGAVLEDGQFQIAEKILRHFVGGLGAGDHVLLNGLPRHVGQAKDVDGILGVEGVISLECSAEVVRERIRRNSGGDRTGRVDDDLAAVERKLEVYASRTLPLIEHYRLLGVAVHVVGVGVETSAGEVHRQLSTGE